MDNSAFFLSLAYPQINLFNSIAVWSAISLFITFFIWQLFSRREKINADEMRSLPFYVDFMYPRWLDTLTCMGIIKAFAWSLSLAIISWTILASMLLIVLMKVYGS